MDFSFSSLFAGFVFGVISFWMLKQGKTKGNATLVILGLAMLVFPYFITNVWIVWPLGIGLGVAAYKLK